MKKNISLYLTVVLFVTEGFVPLYGSKRAITWIKGHKVASLSPFLLIGVALGSVLYIKYLQKKKEYQNICESNREIIKDIKEQKDKNDFTSIVLSFLGFYLDIYNKKDEVKEEAMKKKSGLGKDWQGIKESLQQSCQNEIAQLSSMSYCEYEKKYMMQC